MLKIQEMQLLLSIIPTINKQLKYIMGKQISFFITENDLISFGEYIQKEKKGVFILRTSPFDKVTTINHVLDIPYMSGYITMESLTDKISLKYLKTGVYIVETISPIIEFTQCKILDNGLKSARLLYQTGYYNQDGVLVKFSPEYIKWCEEIFKWIKKNYKPSPYPEYKGYRISQEVISLVENKQVVLFKK